MYRKIAENSPATTLAAEALFMAAATYDDMDDFENAVNLYERIELMARGSDLAANASFRRGVCSYRIAMKRPRDEATCRKALAVLSGYIAAYPAHGGINEAITYRDDLHGRLCRMYYNRAVFYDRKAKKPESAIIAYRVFLRKFPLSGQAEKDRERLAALENQKDHETENR